MRYYWIASLVSGVACLKMGKYALAAVLITFSAMFQIFPVLFLVAMFVKIGHSTISLRSILSIHKRFLIATLAAGAVLGCLSVSVGRGTGNWDEFLHQMDLNSGRMAIGRIGYVYNFLYPKEVDRDVKQERYENKVERAKENKIGFFSQWDAMYITAAAILFAILLLVGKTDDVEFTLIFGFALFFICFSTVRYYYAGMLGFPLICHRHFDRIPGKIFFAALLALMAVAYLVQPYTLYSFNYNTLLSSGLTVIILAATVFLHLKSVSPHTEMVPLWRKIHRRARSVLISKK